MKKLSYIEFINKLKLKNKSFDENNFQLLSEFYGGNKKIRIKNKYGECEVLPNDLLRTNTLGTIRSAINKKEYWLNQVKESRSDFLGIDYSKIYFKKYKNTEVAVFKCLKHSYTYKQQLRKHLEGHQGCKYCDKGTIRYSNDNIYNNIEFFKNMNGFFYVILLSSKEEIFYKIGITNKDVKHRINQFNKNYETKLLYEIKQSIIDCFNLEQRLLKEFSNYKYTPKINFSGKTECLTINPIDEYNMWFEKYIQYDK